MYVMNSYWKCKELLLLVKREPLTRTMKTGKIEVHAEQITVLNKAKTPPFAIADETDVSEDIRLKYRYLDFDVLRCLTRLKCVNDITKTIRDFLDQKDF